MPTTPVSNANIQQSVSDIENTVDSPMDDEILSCKRRMSGNKKKSHLQKSTRSEPNSPLMTRKVHKVCRLVLATTSANVLEIGQCMERHVSVITKVKMSNELSYNV